MKLNTLGPHSGTYFLLINALCLSIFSASAVSQIHHNPAEAVLIFMQSDTKYCLQGGNGNGRRQNEVFLKNCFPDQHPRQDEQIWTVRHDATLYNAGRDLCLGREDEKSIALTACNSDSPEQKWWVTVEDGAYQVADFFAQDSCIVTTGNKNNPSDLQLGDCSSTSKPHFDVTAIEPEGITVGELPPPNTGVLQNIRQIVPEGFGDNFNKYAWSIAEYKDALYIGTLSAATHKDLTEFTEDVVINTKGAEVWKGTTSDGGATWDWATSFTGGLTDINNFGVRKMLNCGDDLLGVYMNNASGFGLLRFDGDTWTTEFSEGGPTVAQGGQSGMQAADNVSGRGMVVFNDYLYIGIANVSNSAQMWRRKVDSACNWVADWEVITDDGFGFSSSANKNIWFGDIIEFNGYLYVGTLNYGGAQIWRSPTGNPGVANWKRVYKAVIVGDKGNINVIKLRIYQGHIVAGTQDSRQGGELLVSGSGEDGSFQTFLDRGISGDSRNTYAWYLEEAFGTLFAFMGNNITGYQIFNIPDITVESYGVDTTNSFNSFKKSFDYYGIRTALDYQPPGDYDPILIMGTANSATNVGLRVYAADAAAVVDPDNLAHTIFRSALPGPDGPVECLNVLAGETGTILNNGKAWVDWSITGSLVVHGQKGQLWSTDTPGSEEFCFQKDGNIVVYQHVGKQDQTFATGTTDDHKATRMVLNSDCNLEAIYGFVPPFILWQSDTVCDN